MSRRQHATTTAQPTTARAPTTASADTPTVLRPTDADTETVEFGSGPCYADDDGAMSTDAGDHAIPEFTDASDDTVTESADDSRIGRGESA
jgi:hypothetical protein